MASAILAQVVRLPPSRASMGGTRRAMSDSPLITAVIPAFNPQRFLLEAIASVERQTHPNWEIVLVDDGTDEDAGRDLIAQVEQRADPRIRALHQPNRGLAAARNAGFRASRGDYVLPLDADDKIEPDMMEAALRELQGRDEAAFVYTDYRVFGESSYMERPGEYNLYRLTQRNFLSYCMLIRKSVWDEVGGYPEEMRWGYEDWTFAIKMGVHGHYGRYLPRTLFHYRRQGESLYSIALARHDENLALMRRLVPQALSPEGLLKLKRRWQPAICVVASGGPAPDLSSQTLRDYQIVAAFRRRHGARAIPCSGLPVA